MARPILNIGKSGAGKSASLRNFDNGDYALINVLGKDLPFRNNKNAAFTDNYDEVKRLINGHIKNGVKTIIIDDAGYLLTRGLIESNTAKDTFKHFRKMATDFIDLVQFTTLVPDSQGVNIVFNMHETYDEFGGIKPKTIGKMLDEQFTLEGYFTIVIRTVKTTDGHKFVLHSDGLDVIKTPIGMFEEQTMDNDLKAFLKQVNEYYNTGGNE